MIHLHEGSEYSEGEVLNALGQFTEVFAQNPIMNLMRSSFRSLVATDDGVYERNRLQTDMDPNFSNSIKMLRYGLRGKYGQDTFPVNTPVPKVGIEFRNDGSFMNTMRHASEVEDRLHKDVPEGERGLEDNVDRLRELTQSYGIDSRVVAAAYSSVETGFDEIKNSRWGKIPTVTTFLLPLTPWENHPLYLAGLKRIDEPNRREKRGMFMAARASYKARINALVKAYYEGTASPDLAPWIRDQEGKLLFGPDSHVHLGPNNYKVNRHKLFQLILFVEMIRFLRDSSVANVMEWGS